MFLRHPEIDAVLQLHSGMIEVEIYLHGNQPNFAEHPQQFLLDGFDDVDFVEF
ncbi:hypothetical protein NIES2104_40120 [Leptolyngbya sp. NIES-2104]|nr:hypothetical protein NIES2104_40120 [Leptolyngbya sp. NIES-2104]